MRQAKGVTHGYGNNGNDFLVGGEGNDWLTGAKGNDALWGGNGIDYIEAGAGNDIIIANDDDGLRADEVLAFEPPLTPYGALFRDYVNGGAGDDLVYATHEDLAHGGSGNDRIELSDCTDSWGFGQVSGGNGDDVIVNTAASKVVFISTGDTSISTYPFEWTPANKAAYGGFNDTVIGGDGKDIVTTMQYCNATVETGRGNDEVFAVGLHDVISTGDGIDMLYVYGGAVTADLGDDIDILVISRGTYDNPNVSEITLGGGGDYVWFNMNEWRSFSENKQPLSKAPWVLDFHPDVDWIRRINLTNVDDPSLSLRRDRIYAFDIEGGSALYYDDPAGSGQDFCFARFAGVSALALQEHVNLYTEFV